MKRMISPTICICALLVTVCGYLTLAQADLLTPNVYGQTHDLKIRKAASTQSVTTPAALPTTLFFSEYIEGSGDNKSLEIYNGTGAEVNLGTDKYTLEVYLDGNTTTSLVGNLNGRVANNDVFVISHGLANATIIAASDDVNSALLSFDGNDAVVLKKNGVIVDVIGQVGFNPVTEWGTGFQSTRDNTIVRNSSVCAGDTNPSNAFTPVTEWTGFASNTFTNLGSHTASCSAPPPSLSINDVTLAEGNAGTTTFAFTVSLSAPAPAGGVSFDIATADGVANDGNPFSEDSDYVAASLTGQTILAGNSTYTFNVSVTGDTVMEPNEVFYVNVTNIVGATTADAQGQGTITNDDVVLTAGPVSISGRVISNSRRGIARATVSLTDQSGTIRKVKANSFGYFKFNEVPSGESYVLSISARGYRFSPRVVNASDDVVALEISPE